MILLTLGIKYFRIFLSFFFVYIFLIKFFFQPFEFYIIILCLSHLFHFTENIEDELYLFYFKINK